MRVLITDDERNAVKNLKEIVGELLPKADIDVFRSSEEALETSREYPPDIAFLDIEMPVIDGVELARLLKEINPRINIIFTTGYSSYTADAMNLRASGYVMKPVTKQDVCTELDNLRYPVTSDEPGQLYIRTFGKFEVFEGETPVRFQYSKTKELLAYLVDRRGAYCTNKELMQVLWGEEEAGKHLSYLKNLKVDLVSVMKKMNAEDAILRQRNGIAVNPSKFTSDYYEWIRGNRTYNGGFPGEYMSQYEWAQTTKAFIEKEEQR